MRPLDVMRWGLVPFWANDIKVSFSNINAKAEAGGTDGSNSSPCSDESRANLTSSAQILEKARSQWRAWSRVPVPERAVNCAVAV